MRLSACSKRLCYLAAALSVLMLNQVKIKEVGDLTLLARARCIFSKKYSFLYGQGHGLRAGSIHLSQVECVYFSSGELLGV
jgi:hypothetical protein